MKEDILCLIKASDGYISGEEISNLLGVSRTAVWKHINTLKEDGYLIESVTKMGYRLIKSPDRLYPQEIKEHLMTYRLGQEITYREVVESTNLTARELADLEAPEGLLVVAEGQTAGKGRLGRGWYSPTASGVWMSVLLRPQFSPAEAPKITLVTAIAVAKAIEKFSGITPGIKWPNDILLYGKKVCGILMEMKADMDQVHYVIVGMGINVNLDDFPEDIADQAVSLSRHTGEKLDRSRLAAEILNELEGYYHRLLDEGFINLREDWKKYSATIGQEVTVTTLKERFQGIAEDIDEDGMLLVKDEGGSLHKIIAGDVTLRTQNI